MPIDTVIPGEMIRAEKINEIIRACNVLTQANINDIGEVIGIRRVTKDRGTGTWVNIDKDGNEVEVDYRYFENHDVWGGIVEELIDEQIMVKIPKFYYKNDNYDNIFISPYKALNFQVHPAFMYKGQEIDCFWIGKYTASLLDVKACSLPNEKIYTNVRMMDAIDLCNVRNKNGIDGFMLGSIYQYHAINMLMLIEEKTTDLQRMIGRGNVDNDRVVGPNEIPNTQANYRGIVGLWGNVWEYVQGCRINSNGVYEIWNNKGHDEYISTGVKAKTLESWGYMTDMSVISGENFDMKSVFLPDETQSIEVSYLRAGFSDGFYGGKGVCKIGGQFNSLDYAGPFCLSFKDGAGTMDSSSGFRLCKV